jgi:general secretion pathway protein G
MGLTRLGGSGRKEAIVSVDTSLLRLVPRSPHRVPERCERHAAIRDAGFTLLELLVVMVIIGLLAGLVAPQYFNQIGKSNVKIAKAQIDSLGKALDQYRLDVGVYPTTEEGLDALFARPQNEPNWSGPYLKKAVPLDPWNRPYVYRSPGEHGEYDLYSLGKSGQQGGTGEDVAITSW